MLRFGRPVALGELGFDENFKLVWMQYTQTSGFFTRTVPTKGFTQLIEADPFDNPMTMGFLFFHEQIAETSYSQTPWMEFIATFVKPDAPKVYPSADAKACASESDINLADVVSAELDTEDGSKSLTVKLDEESGVLANLDLKAAIVADMKGKKDYTGDPVLQDLQATLEGIEDIDDAFKIILNRLPIADLLLRLLACLQIDFPSIEIDISGITDALSDLSDIAGGLQDLYRSVDAVWEPELPKNFKIPKLSLPDEMPVSDIMAGFKKMLMEMVKEMIAQMFVEMVKALLEGLVADCKDGDNNTTDDFGGENIGDMLDENGADPASLADLFDALGVSPDELEEDDDTAAAGDEEGGLTEETPAAQIGGFLDDTSALLTPGELCALLNGNPPDYVVDLVKSLIVNYRQEFSSLNSKSKIVAVFRAIGGLADSSLCDHLADETTGAPKLYLPTDRPLCDTDGSLRRLREDLLREKREDEDDITDDQIEEMLDKVKERKKKQAEQIKDMLEEMEDNDGEFTAPPVFCMKMPDGSILPGMIDELPESVTWMLEKVIDTAFEPTYMAFNLDAKEWAKPFIETVPIKQEVPTLIEVEMPKLDSDGEPKEGKFETSYVPHPEVKRLLAMGASEKQYFTKPEVEIEKEKHAINKTVEVDLQKKRVAPHLKDSLAELETNEAFEMNYDSSGSYYYELILPPDPNAVDAMSSLKDMDEDAFAVAGIDTADFAKFEEALPIWSIQYHLPIGTVDEDSTALDDEYIIVVKQNEQEVLHFENTVEMNPTRKNAIKDKIDSDFSAVDYSPQQEVFGEYVKSMWQNSVGSSEDLTELYDSMATYFKEGIFSQISKDLFSHVGREVADSQFFNVTEGTVGTGDSKIYSWTPDIEQVVLNPDPTDNQRACGIDPHLLNLNCLKKKVLEDALAGMCDDPPPPTDGKGSDEMNFIERALMDAVIRTTIRANLIDYFLRGVFAFSTFDLDAVLDSAALDMFANLMKQDFKAYSEAYLVAFLAQADITYDNMVAEGYFEEEEVERESGKASGLINEFSKPSGWSLPYLIKEQIVDVAVDLQTMLGTADQTTSVRDKWLSTYVPVFNAASGSYDVRFAELNDDVVTAENYSDSNDAGSEDDDGNYVFGDTWEGYETDDTAIDVESLITEKDGISFDLENGNFILERYIKVVDSSSEDTPTYLSEARAPITDSSGSLISSDYENTTGVVNLTNFSELIKHLVETDPSGTAGTRSETELGDLFSSLKYGYRLTYLPPMSDSQMVEVPYVTGSSGSTPQPNTDYSSVATSQDFPSITTSMGDSTYNFGEVVQKFGEEHWQGAKDTAAFAIYETFPADKVTFDFTSTGSSSLEDTEIVRLVTPIPLVTVEEDIDLTYTLGDVDNGTYFESNHPTTNLHTALQEDEWFDVLFGYVFPLNRFMSIMTLYTITAVSNYDGVPMSFEGTRDELHRLFWIALNGGDYTYEDDNLMCIGGSGGLGNSSGKLASTLAKCFGLNFGFGMCMKGLGLGFVFKMMLMTPVLIFKLIVEFMDPNIKIAVKLFSLGCLLGIAIPVPIISFGMLPMNIFLGMPGPPITPLGLIYLALGLGNIDLSYEASLKETEKIGVTEEGDCEEEEPC